MQIKGVIAVVFLALQPLFVWSSDCAVTYEPSERRFGDNLLGYLHAKWISYRYKIPLLYKPFLYSEEFALHENEIPWSEEKQKNFDHVINYTKEEDFPPSQEGSVLYVIPFFSELSDDRQYQSSWIYFPVDWKDEGFVNLLRPLFCQRKEYPAIAFPNDKNYLTVALHVRRGGGYDYLNAHLLWPLRFLPDSYYLESLRKLCALFPNRPLYAHLFTDDPDPLKIVAKYQSALSDLPITFGCRKEKNRHDDHVVEDFLSMMHFDCLIRSQSNYSLVPAALADYKVVMTPKHYSLYLWHENNEYRVENYIDQIDIEIKSP